MASSRSNTEMSSISEADSAKKRDRGSMSFIFSNSQEQEEENKIDIDSEDDFVIDKKIQVPRGKKYRKLKKNSTITVCKFEPYLESGCNLKKEKPESVIKSTKNPLEKDIEEAKNCDNVIQKMASDVIKSFEIHRSSSPSNMIGEEQENTTFVSSISHSQQVQPCVTVSQAQTLAPDMSSKTKSAEKNKNEADGQDRTGGYLTRQIPPSTIPRRVISPYKDMLYNLIKSSLIEEEVIDGKKSKWNCVCCKKKWVVSKKTATRHMESHLPLKKCQFCEKKFKTRETLAVHSRSAHNNNNENLTRHTLNLTLVSSNNNISSTSSMLTSKTIQQVERIEENDTPDGNKSETDHYYNLDVSRPVHNSKPEQIEKRKKSTRLFQFLPPSTLSLPHSSGRSPTIPVSSLTNTSVSAGDSVLGVRSSQLYSPGLTRQSASCNLRPGTPMPLYRPGCSISRHHSSSGLILSNFRSMTSPVKPAATSSHSSQFLPTVISLDSSPPYQEQTCPYSPGTLYTHSLPGITKKNVPTITKQGWAPHQGLSVVRTPSSRKEGSSLSLSTLSTVFRQLGEEEGRKRVVKFELTQEQIMGLEALGVRETLL